MLNPKLIERQGLSEDDVIELDNLHQTRKDLFDAMDKLEPGHDTELLHLYASLLESLEYNMQRVWKFPQDSAFHTWWFKVPHCKCPKIDNGDPLSYGKIIRNDCPIHGVQEQEK